MGNHSIAFIGLGIMGLPMAAHLLEAGELHINSRTKSKSEPLIAKGAHWHDTPAQAASHATHTFICVPDTPDVEAVVLDDQGVLAGAPSGSVIIDHSTISPAATRKMA